MGRSGRAVAWGAIGLGLAACLFFAVDGRRVLQTPVAWAGEKPSGPPPLKVDLKTPLLLEAPKKSDSEEPSERIVADNEACYVCHGNYRDEPMARAHAKVNVGCVKCHGSSAAHREDEDNITPPDVMYPLDKLDAMCRECHDTHDAPPRKVLARWKERCPTKTNVDEIVCTDCHGQHRLEHRTVRWDKATRKLLAQPPKPGK